MHTHISIQTPLTLAASVVVLYSFVSLCVLNAHILKTTGYFRTGDYTACVITGHGMTLLHSCLHTKRQEAWVLYGFPETTESKTCSKFRSGDKCFSTTARFPSHTGYAIHHEQRLCHHRRLMDLNSHVVADATFHSPKSFQLS